MVERGEHLPGDENSFFIRTVDGYFIRDRMGSMRHEKMDKEFTIHYDNRRKGKRQENGVAIWLWILILSLMLLISLTTSPLTIEEDATIFDDGTLPLAEIYLSPGITVGYVIVSAQSGATKRDIYIGSESLFTGC